MSYIIDLTVGQIKLRHCNIHLYLVSLLIIEVACSWNNSLQEKQTSLSHVHLKSAPRLIISWWCKRVLTFSCDIIIYSTNCKWLEDMTCVITNFVASDTSKNTYAQIWSFPKAIISSSYNDQRYLHYISKWSSLYSAVQSNRILYMVW